MGSTVARFDLDANEKRVRDTVTEGLGFKKLKCEEEREKEGFARIERWNLGRCAKIISDRFSSK
jgi:hypothetical protein